MKGVRKKWPASWPNIWGEIVQMLIFTLTYMKQLSYGARQCETMWQKELSDRKVSENQETEKAVNSLGLERGRRKYLRNYQVPETIISALVPSNLNHRVIHEVPHATAQVRTLQLLPLNRVALWADKEPTKGIGSWRIILYVTTGNGTRVGANVKKVSDPFYLPKDVPK